MEKVFAICISQKDKEDYSIALPLEEIDDKFITLGKEGVLQKIREYDSVMQEKDPSKLAIKVLGKNNVDKALNINVIITNTIPLKLQLLIKFAK